MQTWQYIESGLSNGFQNMKTDLELLQSAINNNNSPVLRIYGWNPCAISLGCNQDESGIDMDLCNKHSIDIVKRPTGGRAILHQGDITYSFIIKDNMLKNGKSIKDTYKQISSALVLALENIGVKGVYVSESNACYTKSAACMAVSTGADLEYNKHKIAGSAQLRKKGYILQHGSILINQDFNLTSKLLGVETESLNCINVSTIINYVPSYSSLALAIKEGFEKYFNVKLV